MDDDNWMLGISLINTIYEDIHKSNEAYLFESDCKSIWNKNKRIKENYGIKTNKCQI